MSIPTPPFLASIIFPLLAWAAWADALNPNEGEARDKSYFFDSGIVWGVDPLLRTSDFDNAAELKGLKSKRPRLLKEKYEAIWAGRFKPTSHFHWMLAFTLKMSSDLWQADQAKLTSNFKVTTMMAIKDQDN